MLWRWAGRPELFQQAAEALCGPGVTALPLTSGQGLAVSLSDGGRIVLPGDRVQKTIYALVTWGVVRS